MKCLFHVDFMSVSNPLVEIQPCLEDESHVGMRGFLHVDTVLNQTVFNPPYFWSRYMYQCIYINTVRNLEPSIFDCMFHRDFIHANLQKKQFVY